MNTPRPLAQKYWITNGACHAKWIVVFAQLHVGGKNEGIHGVLVRCRDDKLGPVPGVTVEDMGHKMGLNGVDNAKLTFDNVRVPRANLLNRYSDITEDGQFVSSIKQGGRARFLAMADQLLSGRICIASGCVVNSDIILSTANEIKSIQLFNRSVPRPAYRSPFVTRRPASPSVPPESRTPPSCATNCSRGRSCRSWPRRTP